MTLYAVATTALCAEQNQQAAVTRALVQSVLNPSFDEEHPRTRSPSVVSRGSHEAAGATSECSTAPTSPELPNMVIHEAAQSFSPMTTTVCPQQGGQHEEVMWTPEQSLALTTSQSFTAALAPGFTYQMMSRQAIESYLPMTTAAADDQAQPAALMWTPMQYVAHSSPECSAAASFPGWPGQMMIHQATEADSFATTTVAVDQAQLAAPMLTSMQCVPHTSPECSATGSFSGWPCQTLLIHQATESDSCVTSAVAADQAQLAAPMWTPLQCGAYSSPECSTATSLPGVPCQMMIHQATQSNDPMTATNAEQYQQAAALPIPIQCVANTTSERSTSASCPGLPLSAAMHQGIGTMGHAPSHQELQSFTFTIPLRRSDDGKLGLTVGPCPLGNMLRIESVQEAGVAGCWNKLTSDNDPRRFLPGDAITDINGIMHDTKAMIQELHTRRIVKIKIMRLSPVQCQPAGAEPFPNQPGSSQAAASDQSYDHIGWLQPTYNTAQIWNPADNTEMQTASGKSQLGQKYKSQEELSAGQKLLQMVNGGIQTSMTPAPHDQPACVNPDEAARATEILLRALAPDGSSSKHRRKKRMF